MQSIRNIAIIAHVDHGKTTLVDKIIDQAHILDERKVRTELLLDNNADVNLFNSKTGNLIIYTIIVGSLILYFVNIENTYGITFI